MAEVKGDLIVKQHLTVDGNAKFQKGVDIPYLELIDKKNSDGGTFTNAAPNAGAWQTRDITTTVHNDFATSITLTSTPGDGNAQFTIPAGTYVLEASCPAHEVEQHVARLADVTDLSGANGVTVVLGTAEYSADSDLWRTTTPDEALAVSAASQTRSHVTGRFTVNRATDLEIQHVGQVTKTTTGLGYGANFYMTTGYVGNVYTTLKMWQVNETGS